MSYTSPDVLDASLSKIDLECNRIDFCSALPSTFAQATSTYSLGYKANPTISAPVTYDTSKRKITVEAFTDGVGTASGTIGFWALSDTNNSKLLLAGSVAASKAVVSTIAISCSAFDISSEGE